MNDQEREQLATTFDGIAKQLDAIYTRLNELSVQYPGLDVEKMFYQMYEATKDASINAECLADYVRVATDEKWKASR